MSIKYMCMVLYLQKKYKALEKALDLHWLVMDEDDDDNSLICRST